MKKKKKKEKKMKKTNKRKRNSLCIVVIIKFALKHRIAQMIMNNIMNECNNYLYLSYF